MNLGLRAILYTVRKWKKTLLVFCLILSISTLVLSGLAALLFRETYLQAAGQAEAAVLTAHRNL